MHPRSRSRKGQRMGVGSRCEIAKLWNNIGRAALMILPARHDDLQTRCRNVLTTHEQKRSKAAIWPALARTKPPRYPGSFSLLPRDVSVPICGGKPTVCSNCWHLYTIHKQKNPGMSSSKKSKYAIYVHNARIAALASCAGLYIQGTPAQIPKIRLTSDRPRANGNSAAAPICLKLAHPRTHTLLLFLPCSCILGLALAVGVVLSCITFQVVCGAHVYICTVLYNERDNSFAHSRLLTAGQLATGGQAIISISRSRQGSSPTRIPRVHLPRAPSDTLDVLPESQEQSLATARPQARPCSQRSRTCPCSGSFCTSEHSLQTVMADSSFNS